MIRNDVLKNQMLLPKGILHLHKISLHNITENGCSSFSLVKGHLRLELNNNHLYDKEIFFLKFISLLNNEDVELNFVRVYQA